jgi:hypothetical protein
MSTLSVLITRRPSRNVYDDTFVILIDGEVVKTYKCNSQPAGGSPLPKGRGMVATGTWLYKPGIHGLSKPPSRRYAAFVQAKPINVVRADGRGGWDDEEQVEYSFNIHCGGYSRVSSLGCITLHPDVWKEVKDFIYNKLDSFDQPRFNVTIVNEGEAPKTKQTTPPRATKIYHLISPSGKVTIVTTARMVGGYGIMRVRNAIAALCDLKPNEVVFDMKTINDDFVIVYNGVNLEDVDVEGEEGVTWCYVRDIITATGSTVSFDNDNNIVKITNKGT